MEEKKGTIDPELQQFQQFYSKLKIIYCDKVKSLICLIIHPIAFYVNVTVITDRCISRDTVFVPIAILLTLWSITVGTYRRSKLIQNIEIFFSTILNHRQIFHWKNKTFYNEIMSFPNWLTGLVMVIKMCYMFFWCLKDASPSLLFANMSIYASIYR